MAKVITRALPNFYYATVKAVFDEVAEDCSLLEVSNNGFDLILTIDTDLVATVRLSEAASTYGLRTVYFNGNSLMNTSSGAGVGNPKVVIAYTDSFFMFLLLGGTSVLMWVNYEKLVNEKFANASSSILLDTLYDTSKVQLTRRLISGTPYSMDQGYIDYMDKTPIIRNSGTRLSEFDSNYIYVANSVNFQYSIITMDNKDYYAITNQYLIPIDPE